MKSNLISKSETASLLKTISSQWNMDIPKSKNLKVHYIADDAQLVTGKGFKILSIDGKYVPFLSDTETLAKFPSVTVDMGAVKALCKGANIMRPGIKSFTEFEKDSLVCIIDESQHKFLAVGQSIISSKDASVMEKGQVLKNMHYISDKFWEIGKTIHD